MADVATIRAAANAAIAEFGTGVHQIRERGDAARAAMQSAAATVASPDGAVIATVGADGALTAISFGPAASSLSRETLGVRVVETTRSAHAAALAEAAQRVAAIVGADTEPVAVLRREHDELAPPQANTPPPTASPSGEGFSGRGR